MAKFARGKYSWGIDDTSGFKVRHRDLKKQWDGWMVADPDFDTKHPLITPVRVFSDALGLRDPRPDNDAELRGTGTGFTSDITPYPTQMTTDYPNNNTFTATTQLYEAIDVTFGGAPSSPSNVSFPTQTGVDG